jgi:YD repeat-containing protein
VFTWTPTLTQTGNFVVHFAVSDGLLSNGQDVTIAVAPAPVAPTFAQLPPLLGKEGVALQFTVSAGDTDGSVLSFSLGSALPKGAVFNPTTQSLTWTPAHGQAGAYTLVFVATDPATGASAQESVSLTIQMTDVAPTLGALGGHVAIIGQAFTLPIMGSSPEVGAVLTYSATGLPAGATINPATGLLNWTPSGVQAGTYDVLVTVSDGQLATIQPLVLVASARPVPPAVLITLTPSFPVPLGQNVLVHVTASGISNITGLTLTIDGQAMTLDAQGRATYVAAVAGHHTLVATATDADGQVGTITSDLKVRDPADATATPVVHLTLPTSGAVLNQVTSIIGTVSDANLDQYELDLLPVGTSNVIVLAKGTASITNAAIASIDPNKLANGAYELRLTATNMAGHSSTVTSLVEIDSAAVKSGSFTTSTTDLTATLDGITVQFTRSYQSVSSTTSGSLGYGWTLDGFDPKITSDVTPTGSESTGVFNAFQPGTRVYVTLPDGTRGAFTFTPTSTKVGPLTILHPAWTADAGVSFHLSTVDALLENDGGSLYQIGTGLPYNPASGRFAAPAWSVTGSDGTRYDYSASGKLLDIVSHTGAKLIASDSGLVAPNGQSISFRTDSAGRITAILASDGTQVLYTYNAAGDLVRVNDLQTGAISAYEYNAANQLTAAVQAGSASAITYDAMGNLLAVTPISLNLGVTHQFLGQTFGATHVAGGSEAYSFILSDTEVGTVLSGSVLVGIEITSASGFVPAVPTINGLAPLTTVVQGGHVVALYELPAGGVYVVSVAGSGAGAYGIQVYLPGDVNGDGRVDGTDEQAFDSAMGSSSGQAGYSLGADADRNGVVNLQDQLILEQNFGFVADQPPVATSTTLATRQGVPITIDLSTLASDPQGHLIGYVLSNAQHGTVTLSQDGHTATFTPDAGYFGPASFNFVSEDPSASSNVATNSINVQTAVLEDIQFQQKDPHLNVGQTNVLTVIATYADGTTGAIPASLLTFTSSNPSVATVGPNGAIAVLNTGQTILTATVDGFTAATPLAVGTVTASVLNFSPSVYALPIGQSVQFRVDQTGSDGLLTDVSAASNGTVYILSNPNLGTITADGLFTGTTAGTELVTVIKDGQSQITTLTVSQPVTTGAATVGSGGVVVQDSEGDDVGAGPGALPATSQIAVTTLASANLPAPLPTGFPYAAGFTLSIGANSASNTPLSLSIPAPAGTQVGQVLWLFRYGQVLEDNFVVENMWQLVGSLTVEGDGHAVLAPSAIYTNIVAGGQYAVTVPDPTQVSIVSGKFSAPAPASPTVAGTFAPADLGGTTTINPSGPGTLIVSPNAGPGAYNAVTTAGFTFYFPVLTPTAVLFYTLDVYGHAQKQQVPVVPVPGQTQTINVTIPNPVGVPGNGSPIVTGISLGYDPTANNNQGGAQLTITGSNFDSDNTKDVVYIFAGEQAGFPIQLDDSQQQPSKLANAPLYPALTVAQASANTLVLNIPAGYQLGGNSLAVGTLVATATPVPGQNPILQNQLVITPAVKFQTSSAPNYVYAVTSNYVYTNPSGQTIYAPYGALEVLAPGASGVPGLVAVIPVGVNPSQVVVSPDGLTVWVTNIGSRSLSVIDATTLTAINLDPQNVDNLPNNSQIPLQGSPNYLTIAPVGPNGDYRVFVDDRYNGNLYTIDSRIIQDLQTGLGYEADVQTATYAKGIAGAEGIAVAYSNGSSGGEYAYIASAGTGDQAGGDNTGIAGDIFIVHVGDLTGHSLPGGAQTVKTILTDPKPYGVTSYQIAGTWYVGVTIRGNQPTGYTLIDADTQNSMSIPSELGQYPQTISDVIAQLAPQKVSTVLFDTYNAQAIVYDKIGKDYYGFVLFRNTYQQGSLAHDPTYGAGGNIGILANPFGIGGKPYFIGATAEIPSLNGSFPTDLTLSPDGSSLYVTVTGLNQVYVYSVQRIMATIGILSIYDSAAVNGPAANQPKPQSLDSYATQILASGSLTAYLASLGSSGASPSNNTNNNFTSYLATLQTGPYAPLPNIYDTSGKALPSDPLISAIFNTGLDSNPLGIASAPLKPDIAAVSATTNNTGGVGGNGTITLNFSVVGSLSGQEVDINIYAPGNIDITVPIDPKKLVPGPLESQIIPLALPLSAGIGPITVTIIAKDPADDDSVLTNDSAVVTPVKEGLTALYGDSPTINKVAMPNTFGQFIQDVPLPDSFTYNVDPSLVSRVATILISQGSASGPVIEKFTDSDQTLTFAFPSKINVGAIANGTTWVVTLYDSTNQPILTQTYTFDMLVLPDWLKTTDDTTKNTVQWDEKQNGGKGAYVIDHEDYLISQTLANLPAGNIPSWIPLIGGGFSFNAGDVIDFQFDLNGGVVDNTLDYGPAIFYKIAGVTGELHLPIETIASSGLIPQSITPIQLNLSSAQSLASLFEEKAVPSGDTLAAKQAANASSNSRGPVTVAGAFGYQPFVIDNNLSITSGSFSLGLQLGYPLTFQLPDFFRAPPTSPIYFYLTGSFQLVPNITLQYNFAADHNTLTLGGEIIPDITLAAQLKAGVTTAISHFFGLPPIAEAAVNAKLDFKWVIAFGTTPSAFTIPFSLTATLNVGGRAVGGEIVLFAIDNVNPFNGNTKNYTILGKQAAVGNPLTSPSGVFLGLLSEDNSTLVFTPAADPVTISANNTLPTATDLGAPMGVQTFSESLLSDQDANVFHFLVVNPTTASNQIALAFNQSSPNATAFVQDASGNIVATYHASDAMDGIISLAGLPAGAYDLFVQGAPALGVNYTLTFNTPVTAKAYLTSKVTLDKSQVIAGQPFTATVTIENLGAVASNAGVALLVWSDEDNDLGKNSAQLIPGGISVPALAPGQSFTAHYTVVSPATIHGMFTVGLIADAFAQTPQDNTTPARALAHITSDYPADGLQFNGDFADATQIGGLVSTITKSNLVINTPQTVEYFQFTLPTTGTTSDNITLQRTDTSAPAGLTLYDIDGNTVLDAPQANGIGSTGAEQLSLAGLAPGVYFIRVSSVDQSPFPYSLTLTSTPRTGVNLGVANVSVDSSNLTPGLQQTASVTISNFGSQNAGGFNVQLALNINGAIINIGSPFPVSQILAGQELTLSIPFTVPSLAADQQNISASLVATVDPGNTLNSLNPSGDVNETDVYLTGPTDSIHGGSNSGIVDLGPVTGVKTVSDLNLVYQSDAELFSFQTIATGSSADNVTITFAANAGTLSAELINTTTGVVASSTSSSGSLILSLENAPAGFYSLVVTNLEAQTPISYDLSITAPSVAGADLSVQSVSVNSALTTTSTTVSATIANLGSSAVGSFSVQYVLTPDGNPLSADAILLGGPFTLPGMAAGASENDLRVFNLSAIAPGAYQLAILVDPNHLVAQTSSDDDTAETTLDILPAADAYEPNNSIATATPLQPTAGQTMLSNLTLHNTSDVDYFKFTLSTLSTYTDTAVLTYKAGEPDLQFDLINSSGQIMSTITGVNGSATVSLADLLPGTYYLKVSAPSVAGITVGFSSGYTVNLSLASTTTATPNTSTPQSPSAPTNPIVKVITIPTTTTPTTTTTNSTTTTTTQPVVVPSLVTQPLVESAPTIIGVPNGSFSGGASWNTLGNVSFANGEATLTGSDTQLVTELSQILTIPGGSTSITFTLNDLNLLHGLNLPPDAFELAILDPVTHASLLAPDGLSLSDAVLNIQSDGTAYFGPEVTSTGLNQSGGIITSGTPFTITIALNPLSAGQQFQLAFDLITFDGAAGSVSLTNVTFNSTQAPTLVPPAIINNGATQRSSINTIAIPFSEAVTVPLSSLQLFLNGTQAVSLAGASISFDATTNRAVLNLTGVNLADGNYELHVLPGNITDAFGNALDLQGQPFADIPFFKLAGDADGSRTVDAQDLLLVRRSLGGTNPNADLNNDGTVNSSDLQIVSANLGHTLLALSPAQLTLVQNNQAVTTPLTLNYGNVSIGSINTLSFTIENTGQLPLTIGSMQLTGANAGEFSIVLPGLPDSTSGFVLLAGQTQVVNVTFVPGATGSIAAQLLFFQNDSSAADPMTVALAGNVVSTQAPRLLPPVVINGGSAQRSEINTIAMTFSEPVAVSLSSFELFLNGNQPVSLSGAVIRIASPTSPAILNLSAVNLPDGFYDLHILSTGIVDAFGNHLDLGGQAYIDIPFFKLAGDADGSETVDAQDIAAVRRGMGTGDPDLNGDGVVNSVDLQIVSANLGHTLLSLSPAKLTILQGGLAVNGPVTMDFGSMMVGSGPASLSVVLENTGQKLLTIGSMLVTGVNGGEFEFEMDGLPVGSTGITLQAGEIQTVTVTITPTTAGAIKGELEFFSDDATITNPVTIELSGNGIAMPAPTLELPAVINGGATQRSQINTIALTFSEPVSVPLSSFQLFLNGTQAVSLAGAVVRFDSPTSPATLDLSGVSLADGNYILHVLAAGITDGYGNTLDLQGQAYASVPFSKLAGDADGSGTVDAQDLLAVKKANGTSNPNADLNHDGTVNSADLQIVSSNLGHTLFALTPGELTILQNGQPVTMPMTLNYGNLLAGSQAMSLSFTIENSGQQALTIGSMQLAGANAGLFSVALPGLPGSTSGFVLQAGQTQVVTVTFTPGAAGSIAAQLLFQQDNAASNPITTVQLAATVSEPAPAAPLVATPIVVTQTAQPVSPVTTTVSKPTKVVKKPKKPVAKPKAHKPAPAPKTTHKVVTKAPTPKPAKPHAAVKPVVPKAKAKEVKKPKKHS